MKILDRLLIAFFVLCILALSLCIIIIPFNISGFLSVNNILGIVGNMNNNYYYTIGGVILLIAVIRIIFSNFSRKDNNIGSSYLITRNEYGEIIIYSNTIIGLVHSAIEKFSGINNIKTTVNLSEGQVKIQLIGDVMPGVNIPETIKELQILVKEYVENATGAKVDEIMVKTNNVAAHTRIIR